MPELNVDVPIIQCYVRDEFLYNQEKGHGEYTPCVVFGAASITGRALTFHCLLENGAQIARLPISAFCWKKVAQLPVSDLEMWDCFSSHITCHEYEYLKNLEVTVSMVGQGGSLFGRYLCTFDWHKGPMAENPGDVGFKQAHLLRLGTGNFGLMPNTRICWLEPALVTEPFTWGTKPDYKTNEHVWSAENGSYKIRG